MLSIKVPDVISVYMDIPTLLNIVLPACVPTSNCVNAIPKMYKSRQSKHNVKNTERVAVAMPLMSIMSSGMALRSRAIRAMRDSLANLAILKIDALPKPPWPPPPMMNIKPVKIHVSITMKNTKIESNTNQPSRKPFLFTLKALKRESHSNEKKTQNKCSAIWKTGCALIRTCALLWSVSTPIHTALSAITTKVIFSKTGLVAMSRHNPVLW
mmetsp:Transcript_113103/g.325135  ORF Transcript_113103/g.325135 Transcript_113103/m.325135 type:complete len:212 (-) Transcript_113103:262-897(-)